MTHLDGGMPHLVGRALAQVNNTGTANMADTASQLDNLEAELTTLWVTICAIMVFQVGPAYKSSWSSCTALNPPTAAPIKATPCLQMQSGFALLEAGTVRVKNTKNICEHDLSSQLPACSPTCPLADPAGWT